MKYTGWAVLIIGVLIGVYGLFTMLSLIMYFTRNFNWYRGVGQTA